MVGLRFLVSVLVTLEWLCILLSSVSFLFPFPLIDHVCSKPFVFVVLVIHTGREHRLCFLG